jgi:multiple sugar transport system ATP-binding protein
MAPFEAEVIMSEPTGAETVVLLQADGRRMRARVAPDVRLASGQRATFLADTRSACLFDPASERLIA